MRKRIAFGLACLLVVALRADESGGIFGGIRRAQGSAKVRSCQSQLKEIGVALQLYNAIFQRYPERLEDLWSCKRTGLSFKQLHCPDAAHADYHEDKSLAAAYDDETAPGEGCIPLSRGWFKAHPSSYRWVRKSMAENAPNPAAVVIVFERAAAHEGKRGVLFLDGHVESVDEERFQKLSREQGLLPKPRQRRDMTPELSAEIERRIGELGAEAFDEREAATKRLAEIGPAAEEALKKAAGSKEIEVRTRAEQVLASFQEDEE